jgi:hypothetical protein
MSGTVVIVIAALLVWCALSVALALLIGRRLRSDAPSVAPPTWIRPVSGADIRRRDRRPAA